MEQNRQEQLRARKEYEEIERLFEKDRLRDESRREHKDHENEEHRRLLREQIIDVQRRRREEEDRIQREIDDIKREEQNYMNRLKDEIQHAVPKTSFRLQKSDLVI